MKQESIRTTIDIPVVSEITHFSDTTDIPEPLYRELKQQAAARGKSVRALILSGVENVLLQARDRREKRVHFPLIVSDGPTVNLTNQQIYEYVEFP